jgi:rare lipoprotein A
MYRTLASAGALVLVMSVPALGEAGIASVYRDPQPVACGGRLNTKALTAAHKSLPCGTRVRVTHQKNGRTVDVRINDRGPYIRGRIIDLTPAAAAAIGMPFGLASVRLQVIR